MGNTCKPMVVSFQCMTKFTTNKKKKCLRIKPTEKACTWGQKLEKEYSMQKPRIIEYHLAKQSFKNELIYQQGYMMQIGNSRKQPKKFTKADNN